MRSDWNRPEIYDLPKEGERRIMLRVSYDGSMFHGWQSQGGLPSVQGTLSSVVSSIVGADTAVYGSGRTDSGVHALSQACHFDTSSGMSAEKFAIALNTKLPKSIRVLSSEEAPVGFHARYSTMSREYWYLIKESSSMLPFDAGHVTPVKDIPAIPVLSGYASCLVGTHDFTTFASARDMSLSRIRDIYVSEWDMITDAYGASVLRYRTAGNAFLYHQVRSMVGTMLDSAAKGESEEDFRRRLEVKDRKAALRTAQPDGLYLAYVSYDGDDYQWFEDRYGKQGRA